jgi:KUP system potassium uptake protein
VRLVQRFHVVHQHVVLLTVVTEHVPFVPNSGRATVEPLGEGLVRVLLHYGFMQVPRVPASLGPTLAKHGIVENPGEIAYIIGRETLVATRQGHMGRLTEPLFAFLARNARSTTDHFSIPVERVVEVGVQLNL